MEAIDEQIVQHMDLTAIRRLLHYLQTTLLALLRLKDMTCSNNPFLTTQLMIQNSFLTFFYLFEQDACWAGGYKMCPTDQS